MSEEATGSRPSPVLPETPDLLSGMTAAGGRVRLRTLIFIRWVAVLGQTLALLVVQAGLGFDVPLVPAALIIGALAFMNLLTAVRHRGTVWLGDGVASLYLIGDLIQLTALLAITGGLQNPFTILILAPVVVSAATLSRRSTIKLAVVAILGIMALGIWYLPLPWPYPEFYLPSLYVAGILIAMILAVVFIAAYVSSLALEARRMADALGASQLALAREQRLSSLGALAAAAAHELGSPLATIAVVAKELERELPSDSDTAHLREDVSLLRLESERCRRILSELASRPDEDEDTPYHRLPLTGLIEAAAAPFMRDDIDLQIHPEPAVHADYSPEQQPFLPRDPGLMHGLGTLLQNALQFARQQVTVTLDWDDAEIRIHIEDDGPGFDETVLGDLGDPYVSTSGRDERTGEDHMGLGIFIARTLLSRLGARVSFSNRSEGGAKVAITWPRSII
ncbi:ActS/PrrB/RegB family redox-sensitive histidine kinase [Fodinicurvata sediminis]|uniref:ActS/PrrB/RegB family redox-sensitive histidine kinase n=1 Tax=Fodinicurvata sediminis TaxID=1121832 RepID=UPI0003B463D3|nr:ActS/PrrB/RegB family redox-sensitive histidine kinase [Fodinicurvata sediminis]